MAASRSDIKRWIERGKREGASHVIVVCDTFDHDDYPVYVKPGEDPKGRAAEYNGNMQRVMECYALHLDIESQLNEFRAHHYETATPGQVLEEKC